MISFLGPENEANPLVDCKICTLQVMQKVDSGYRLPPLPGCPRVIYELMIMNWWVLLHDWDIHSWAYGTYVDTLLLYLGCYTHNLRMDSIVQDYWLVCTNPGLPTFNAIWSQPDWGTCGDAVVYVNLIPQAPWLLPSSWIQRPPACFATKCGSGAGHPWGCSGHTCTSHHPWSSTRGWGTDVPWPPAEI